jgi:predicted RNA-binding Zn ribbon-like protein
MHWIELEGCRVPVRIGGHPGLDFCNTWAGWEDRANPRGEWLRTYDDFAVWTQHAELVTPSDVRRLRRSARRDPHQALRVLSAARGLRTATHTAVLDPADKRAAALVTAQVRRAGTSIRLEPGTPPRWAFSADTGLELPLMATAWVVGDLLTQVDLGRVKACPGHECGWLFADTSGRRTWCSMASCGNRAKVAAFAHRRRSRPASSTSR